MLPSYVLRSALTLGNTAFRPKVSLMDEVRLPFTAWLTDIDIYGHVNNGRFLTLMDQGRLAHATRTGLLGAWMKTGASSVAASAQIQFRREILPFTRSTLVTRIKGWDARRLHYSQRIVRGERVHAEAEVSIALRMKGRTISALELLEAAGMDVPEGFLEAKLSQTEALAAARGGGNSRSFASESARRWGGGSR